MVSRVSAVEPHEMGRVPRPLQRAGDRVIDGEARDDGSDVVGLTPSPLGQVEVGATRVSAGGAPFRFAVPDEDEFGAGGTGGY